MIYSNRGNVGLKGVSPLIAVIMLIAFVLVVSGIFYSWVSQFAYTQREEMQYCSRASLLLQSAYYNVNTNQINLVTLNTGDVPLEGFSILMSFRNGSVSVNKDYFGREIQPRDAGILSVNLPPNMREVVVQSIQCKGAQDMININNVDGL